MSLNQNAIAAAASLLAHAEDYRVAVHPIDGGGRYVDCGIEARGGLLAGIELARICLGGLGQVSIVPGELGDKAIPLVQVVTDHPVRACLASQYAGWALKEGKFFAMGSGPMRAAAGSEAIFDVIGFRETAEQVIGVLETRKPPPAAIVAKIAQACRVEPAAVTLLGCPHGQPGGRPSNRGAIGGDGVAQAGRAQVRSLADRLGLRHGPAAAGRLERPGRHRADQRRDPVRARVILAVTGDDASLEAIGPQVPSSASRDHGEPFAAIFARYNHDFYAVDPHLFSPAEITFQNIETGKVHTFGQVTPGILARSFGM